MQQTATEQKIESAVSPSLEDMGLSIVRVKLDNSQGNTLQVLLERADGSGITLDECSKATHTISALLDVEDPISEKYNLEVSSPGIDRPLTKLRDFERFVGKEAKVTLHTPIEGQRKITGTITAVEGETVKITQTSDDEKFSINVNEIEAAKLKISDALFKHKK